MICFQTSSLSSTQTEQRKDGCQLWEAFGTHERFIGFLIEHYAGNFLLWPAPDQVRVITPRACLKIPRGAAARDFECGQGGELRANRVRVDADYSATQQQRSAEHCSASSCFHPSKNRPQHAKRCFALRLVIGGRDLEAGAVSVRLHHGGQQGAKPKAEVVAEILAGSKERLP